MGEELIRQTGDQREEDGWWESVLSNHGQMEFGEGQEFYYDKEFLAEEKIDWDLAKKIQTDDEIIEVKVFGFNQGGLLVHNDWLHGFIPASHISKSLYNTSLKERRKISRDYVGQTLSVKIIECKSDEKRVVLSERAAIAGEGTRKKLIASLRPGDVAIGKVTNITDFGVFVDLGGIEGLAHVSELSWGKVVHPRDFVQINGDIRVLVLNVNNDNSRIALSLKRLLPNPWDQLQEKYRPGDRLSAVVSSVTRFGVFAKLEDGIEGLIHVSVIDKTLKLKELRERYKIGQQMLVCILKIDADHHRLGLSLVED